MTGGQLPGIPKEKSEFLAAKWWIQDTKIMFLEFI
jgi:hypothetical protein